MYGYAYALSHARTHARVNNVCLSVYQSVTLSVTLTQNRKLIINVSSAIVVTVEDLSIVSPDKH